MPPGYFRFSSPPVFKVRQNGVVDFWPADSASAAAWAAIQAKMPVVIGQAIVAPWRRASALRNSSIVVSLPFFTRRISPSTSRGAGMTNVPLPQRLLLLASILLTCGRHLSSSSFSRQVFFFAATVGSPFFAFGMSPIRTSIVARQERDFNQLSSNGPAIVANYWQEEPWGRG